MCNYFLKSSVFISQKLALHQNGVEFRKEFNGAIRTPLAMLYDVERPLTMSCELTTFFSSSKDDNKTIRCCGNVHTLLYKKLCYQVNLIKPVTLDDSNTTKIVSEYRMVPEKRKRTIPEKLTYNHLMKYEKTKKWKDEKLRPEYEKDRKREQRLKKKLEATIKK